MALNNNEKQIVTNVYTPITFVNGESDICQSRLAVSYYNRVMRISFALKLKQSGGDYDKYDTANQVSIYLSAIKAKMLLDSIRYMQTPEAEEKGIYNVAVETRQGVLKVSNGKEYNSKTPCISLLYALDNNERKEIVYETKGNNFAVMNLTEDGKFIKREFMNAELDMFATALEEYVKSSSYATAWSVLEASAYSRNAATETMRAIADKVGARNGGGKYSNRSSFLNESNATTDIPKGYEPSSLDEIASSLS